MTCVSSGGSERRAYMFRCWNRQTGESQKLLRKLVGPTPIRDTTGSIESGAYWVKRFGKSERRLTAGQTALICYRGGKPDTEVLKTFAGDCVPVGIGSVAPGFLSFWYVIQQGPFTSFLLFPALLIRCFGLYRIESNKAL